MPKKIAIIAPDLSLIGAQRVAVDFGMRFIHVGYDVTWVVGGLGTFVKEIPDNKVFCFGARYFQALKGLRILEAYLRLARYLSDNKYDVIISIAPLLNRVICFMKCIRIFGGRLVIEDHAYPPRSYQDEFPRNVVRLFYRCTEWLYRYADLLRVLSEECRQYYNQKLNVPEKIIVFPNLMDFDRINDLIQYNNNSICLPTRPRLVYIGRFTSQKNIKFLIRAFRILRSRLDCEFFIIGHGPEETNLRHLVTYLDLNNDVQFIRSSDANYKILSTADVFPIASLWEGMPLVMIEAMYLGIPIVATNFQAGPAFLIGKNCERGWRVDENNVGKFAEILQIVITNKSIVRTKVETAKNFVINNLDIKKRFADYMAIFINGYNHFIL